jgi:hypothetical protein
VSVQQDVDEIALVLLRDCGDRGVHGSRIKR